MTKKNLSEKPVSSKYASRHPKGLEALSEVSVPVTVEREEVHAVDLFDDIEGLLMGDQQEDLNKVAQLRDQAYSLISSAKAMNIKDLERQAKSEAWRWREKQPVEAERRIYNELRNKNGKAEVLLATFKTLQDAFYQHGDAVMAAKFAELRLSVIRKDPRMQKLHIENQTRADEVMQKFELAKAEHDRLYADAADKFETANIIAMEHGWPVTEARKGNGENNK